MPKVKLVIDKAKLQEVVNNLEAGHEFKSQGELWAAVCETQWAKMELIRPLTPQVAYIRAKELGIDVKTGKGALTKGPPTRGRKVINQEQVDNILKSFPAKTRKCVSKIAKGSLRAAIKAKCLECSNFQKAEVRNCPCKLCPLFPFRPFQVIKNEDS